MKAAERKTRVLFTPSPPPQPALVVEKMQVLQGEKAALKSLSFTVPGGGSLMSIVGPNGAGKTTLLKSLLGLLPLEGGHFRFPAFEAQQRVPRLAYVPQRSTVSWDFPLNVFEVALMGTYGDLKWGRRPGKKERARAQAALAQVGLTTEQDKPLSELSGGQAQRVFLARALAQQADFYLLDEPFAAVDLKAEELILEILIQLKKSGKTLLVVHHDLATVKRYFDWVLFLNVTKVAAGPVKKTFTSAVIEKTYSAYQA